MSLKALFSVDFVLFLVCSARALHGHMRNLTYEVFQLKMKILPKALWFGVAQQGRRVAFYLLNHIKGNPLV